MQTQSSRSSTCVFNFVTSQQCYVPNSTAYTVLYYVPRNSLLMCQIKQHIPLMCQYCVTVSHCAKLHIEYVIFPCHIRVMW
jgi:hypothetical protein